MFDLKKLSHIDFPEGFLWGAATSAHQVEGGNTRNNWWAFEQLPGAIERGEKSGRACGHYEKYEEDFDLARSLGHNIHRLSLEWSRICPEPGAFDQKEIDHYRRVLEALKARDMKVFLTLNHFTVPMWFWDQGAFAERGAEIPFADFCGRCAAEYGDLVDYWNTFNEPQVQLLGYLWGIFPPRERDLEKTCRVLAGQLRAHAAGRQAVRSRVPEARVGLVMATGEFRPLRDGDLLDRLYARLYDYLWTEGFIHGVATGRISYPMIGEDEVFPGLKDSCDFWGVNYYTVTRADSRTPRGIAGAFPGERATEMGWTWEPEGLISAVERFARQGVPLFLSENGMAAKDDCERVRFITEHLRALAVAIGRGADVRGYLHWSLLDNFEWCNGFRPRFGLVEVNYETLERKVRSSARFYAEIIRQNALTRETVEKYLPEAYRF